MDDEALAALVATEVRQSVGYLSGNLSEQRRSALAYYYGEPFGNEEEGRSQVVSRDVAEAVDSIMPSLMKIFMSTDKVVEFEPQGPEDEGAAQQATDYINYVFGRLNNGFVVLYSFFKDALLQKNGFVKVYWDEYEDNNVETYEGLSDDEFVYLNQQLEALKANGIDVKLLGHSEENGSHSFQIRVINRKGKICLDPVPPEEVLVNRRAGPDLQKERFVAHRCKKSLSDLREMGFVVEESDDYSEGEYTLERIERYRYEEDAVYEQRDEVDDSMREVWFTEAYILVDYDGDGIAERRQVSMVGNKILKYKDGGSANVEIDRVPLVTCTPVLMPHKLFGLSIADQSMDIQFQKSTVFRQVLDNMYLTNNTRMMALDGMVNIDDLLTVRPGGIVRVKAFDAVKPLQAPPLGAPAFQLLEYFDTVRENRIGVTRYNQGLDADSLNKTATGINTIYTAAQQRIELIARTFAETGVKDMFWAILELVQKHSQKPQMMRLNNGWQQVDPREWKNKFDMTVSVGLGTGTHSMQLQGAQLLLQTSMQLAQTPYAQMLITPQNAFNQLMMLAKAIDPKRANSFFTDPQGQMPPPPPPDPKIVAGLQKAQMQDQTKRVIKAADLVDSAAQRVHEAQMNHMDQTHDTNMQGLDMIVQGMQAGNQMAQPMDQPPMNG